MNSWILVGSFALKIPPEKYRTLLKSEPFMLEITLFHTPLQSGKILLVNSYLKIHFMLTSRTGRRSTCQTFTFLLSQSI